MAGLSRRTYRFLTKLVFAKLALMVAVMMTLMMATMSTQLFMADLTGGDSSQVTGEVAGQIADQVGDYDAPSFSCVATASDTDFPSSTYDNVDISETTENIFVCGVGVDMQDGIRYRYRIAESVDSLVASPIADADDDEIASLNSGVKYNSDFISLSDPVISEVFQVSGPDSFFFSPSDEVSIPEFDLPLVDETSYMVHEICAVYSDADLLVPESILDLPSQGNLTGDDFFDYGSCVRFFYDPVPYLKFGFDIGGEGVVDTAYVSRNLSNAGMSVSISSEDNLKNSVLAGFDPNVVCRHINDGGDAGTYPEAYLRFSGVSTTQDSSCVFGSALLNSQNKFVPDKPSFLEATIPQITIEESRFLPPGASYKISINANKVMSSGGGVVLIDADSLSSESPVSFSNSDSGFVSMVFEDKVASLEASDFSVELVDADSAILSKDINVEITTKPVSVDARDVVPPFISTFRTRFQERDGVYALHVGPHMKGAGSIAGSYADTLLFARGTSAPSVAYNSAGMSDELEDEILPAVYDLERKAKVTLSASSPTSGTFVVNPVIDFEGMTVDTEIPLDLVVRDKAFNASMTRVNLYADVTPPRVAVVDYPAVALARSSEPLKIVASAFDEGASGNKYASGIDSLSLTIKKMKYPSNTVANATALTASDAFSYFEPVLQQSISYGAHPLSISDDEGVFVFDTSSMTPGRYVAEISAVDGVNNVGTSSACSFSASRGNNNDSDNDSSCRVYFDVVSFGLRDVKIDVGDSVFDLPHMNSKTFYVDPDVLSFDIDLSGVVEGVLPEGGIDIQAVISDGTSHLDIDFDRSLASGDAYSASFRGRSVPEPGLPVFSFKLGSTYTIELFVTLDGTQIPIYNSSLSVQQRGSAFVDENPVIVAQDDIAASYLGAAAGAAPRFLKPVEPKLDLSNENSGEIYRLVADGVDDYKVVVRLVDGFGNVMDNFDLEGSVDSSDAPYLDIDVDQIDPNFQKSAMKLLSYGGSWRQDNWKESGKLMYTSDAYFSKSGVSLGRGSAVRLASQSRVYNLNDTCINVASPYSLGEDKASALVFVGGKLATKVSEIGGLVATSPDTSKYYLSPTGQLTMYCKPADGTNPGDGDKTVSIQY